MSFIGGRLPKIREEDKEKDDGEIGTQHLDALGDWFSGTQYGQRYIEGQERNAELQQELMAQPGVFGWMHRMQNTPNETEQKILENINKLSPVDERITTPATYLAIGALVGKGVPKLYNKLNKSPAAHRIAHEAGQNVGRNIDRLRSQAKFAKDQFQYTTGQKLRPMYKKPDPYTNITQVLEGPSKIVQRAKKIYQYHAGAIPFSEAMRRARELPARSGSEYWHQDSELALKKGSITDPDRNDTNKLVFSTGVKPAINWNNYGYTPGTEPTQVRNVSIPELKTQVADSLNAFYQKTQRIVQTRYGTKASAKQIRDALKNQPQYWTNPVTQKIYRVAWKGGLSKRYTLKPINRQYLEKQQSTGVQKQIEGQYQKKIKSDNIDLKKVHDDKYNILEKELRSIQERLAPYDKGEAVKGLDYKNLVKRQNELNVEINNLEQGRYYSEHNIYLQSEKARNYVLDNSGVRINDSSEFQLGNVANQTPRLENLNNPDTLVFKQLKDKLEKVLDEAPDEYFSYPNYIVNSNPRLSGGREGIIRIEYSPIEWQQVPGSDPPIMRPVLTDFKVKGGILSGKSVIEIDAKDLEFIRNNLSTTEDIRNWLSSQHGINPVAQGDSFPRQGFEIRLSKSPVKSTKTQIKEFQKLIEDVQVGRKTWNEVFAEEGIEIVPQTGDAKVKGKGGRDKGSRNRVPGEKGETFLDKLNNAFKGWE